MGFKINWRYALGEVLIVILGISIAFALNNWAQSSRDRETRRQYLESLVDDLESEMQHLEDNISAFKTKIRSVESILPYLAGKQERRDTITYKIFALTDLVAYQRHDITYRTLVNSGDLRLLPDFQLKKELESHYAGQEIIQLDYERQNKIHEKYFADFLIYHMDYTKLMKGDYSFMNDPLLKNIIQSLYGTYSIGIESSKKRMEASEAMKEKLETALTAS